MNHDDLHILAFSDILTTSFITGRVSNQYIANVVYFSFGTNAIISVVALLAFCIIRPLNGVVYAPKLRSGDTAKAPPPISKGFFAWVTPLMKTREVDLIDKLGLDAIIFLRFLRMLRSIFVCLTIGGFIVGFTNLIATSKQPVKELKPPPNNWFLWLTQYGVHGKALYMTIVFTWVFDIIVCYFLWRNYAQVVALKKHYFQSAEYQKALHARTVLVRNDISLKNEYFTILQFYMITNSNFTANKGI